MDMVGKEEPGKTWKRILDSGHFKKKIKYGA